MTIAALVPAFDLTLALHLAWAPSDSAGVRALAALLVSGGAADIAALRLADCLARFPDDGVTWVDRAQAVVAQEQGAQEYGSQEHNGKDSAGSDRRLATARIVRLLWEWNRLDDAIPVLDRTISLLPGDAALLITRGLVLLAAGRARQALADFTAVLAGDAANAAALRGRGLALVQLDRLTEAHETLRQAASQAPGDSAVLGAQAHVSLALGDYANGWRHYETRWSNPSFARSRPDYVQPPWLGDSDLTGKTILLHGEQGFGDIIQFCRYAKLVAGQAGRVLVRVPGPLVRLMRSMEGIQVLDMADPIGAFDCYCPLMSLPLAFGTAVATIPADIPYLRADPALVDGWRMRLRTAPGPRIGVVWAGHAHIVDRATNSYDRRRSIPPDIFGRLLTEAGFAFVSLQKDTVGTGAAPAKAIPARDLMDWTEDLLSILSSPSTPRLPTLPVRLASRCGSSIGMMRAGDGCEGWTGRHGIRPRVCSGSPHPGIGGA